MSDLIDSVTELNSELNDVEKSIFTGVYPTNITDGYLEDLEKKRQGINSWYPQYLNEVYPYF